MTRTIKCPTCGKKIDWDSSKPWRPFCSERCKLIDLGEWASESHRLPGQPAPPQDDNDSGHHH